MGRVLVVDDDLELCELLDKYLRLEGFDLEMVHSGEQGVERALSGEHSLVVLDVMLPGINGVEHDLLEALMRAAGHVVTREDLVKAILGRNLTPYDRSIDTHVSNLRKKLGHHVDGVERIKTIRGVGFVYASLGDPRKE